MQVSAPLTFQNMRTHGSTLSTDHQNGSTDQSTLPRTAMNIHGITLTTDQKTLHQTAMKIHGSTDKKGSDQNTLPRIKIKGQIALIWNKEINSSNLTTVHYKKKDSWELQWEYSEN